MNGRMELREQNGQETWCWLLQQAILLASHFCNILPVRLAAPLLIQLTEAATSTVFYVTSTNLFTSPYT
jgi:hypothetical protein